jgi:hypothetical protein
MSILTPTYDTTTGALKDVQPTKLDPAQVTKGTYDISQWQPTDAEKEMRAMIIKHFALGYTTMYTPRVEFNDLSTIQRMQADEMAFNTYQPNNGMPAWGDVAQAWRSNAMRPIVRNKCVSIAAHATARLIFPKCFAYNDQNDEQQEAAQVMEDLMEWAADQSNYAYHAMARTMTALTDPASIGYTEYCEVYRKVKRPKPGGGYTTETMLDETLSGFQNTVVPVDELYIENFYEPSVQKQGWLIWRRVMSYSLVEAKYNQMPNFKYVKPGVQILLNDANQTFYQVYDQNMRPYDAEEIVYWNRTLDLKIVMVNGVMLSDVDAPNPRNDKLYPFDKFGYEMINNRCFYYKSLAFKMMQDANIINTLYPMIVDGTYLNLMPPMVQIGDEVIGSDVIVPGAVTTLQSAGADLRTITTSNNLTAGLNALAQVEQSIDESSQPPIMEGQQSGQRMTAYAMSRLEANAATVLGLFIQMIAQHVKDFGKLRLGDILQFLTVVDADKITGDAQLVYKTFLLRDKMSNGRSQTRKIAFTPDMPMEPIDGDTQLQMSYDTLKEQGGTESDMELYKVNPELFRDLTYTLTVSPDVLNPRSEDLERQLDLETYDRAIMNPMADQEEIFKLLLSTNPHTKRNPDKYIAQQTQQPPQPMLPNGMGQGQQQQPQGAGQTAPQPSGPRTPQSSPLSAQLPSLTQ